MLISYNEVIKTYLKVLHINEKRNNDDINENGNENQKKTNTPEK